MMKRTTIRTLLIIAAASLLPGCGSSEKAHEVTLAPVRGVQVETVRLQAVPEFYEASGTVHSATSSVLSAQISGTVLEMHAANTYTFAILINGIMATMATMAIATRATPGAPNNLRMIATAIKGFHRVLT